MITYYAVLIAFVGSGAICAAWHCFEQRRDDRSGHIRLRAKNSPYALAERIARELAQERAVRCDTGKHHLRDGAGQPAMALLSGETPLLCGYVPRSNSRAPKHLAARSTRTTGVLS